MEKRCAVEKEDYDLAKHRKRQMEQYRAQVYAQLQLHSLGDVGLVGAARPRARAAHPQGLRNISNCVPTTVGSALPGSGRPHRRAERGGALAPQCPRWSGVAHSWELWERNPRALGPILRPTRAGVRPHCR